MYQLLKRLPLPVKFLLIAVIPVIFISFLTLRLYREKSHNVSFIQKYLDRIHVSSSVSRLIDEMQKERLYSFEYTLNPQQADSMKAQRVFTNEALSRLKQEKDPSVRDFTSYTFLGNIDSVRLELDSGRYTTGDVIHYFSSAIFRLNTLNRPPSIIYLPLEQVYQQLHFQRLLSEMITYQGIINANIYTVLYTKKYPVETLMGTHGTYVVYKSYEKELEVKTTPVTRPLLDTLHQSPALNQIDEYLHQLFTSFRFDSTYNHQQWKVVAATSLNALRKQQQRLLAEVEQAVHHHFENEKNSKTRTLVYLLVITALLAFIVAYTLLVINRSLRELKLAAVRMANGETDLPLEPVSKDAIGSLASSIKKVDEKNKEMALAAQQIGIGNFDVPLQPRGREDVLGHALLQMKENLQQSTTQLQRSREEFKMLADFMPQIVWTATPEGKLEYFNKKWYEITGAREGLGEQSWVPVLHPEDVGPCLTAWYRSVESGAPYEIEYRFRDARTGSYRWYLGRALPIRDEQGKIMKWFGTGTDIHDQKMQKEQLEDLVAQRTVDLRRSNDDLQQFAHVASHDLKEPVRKMRTFSQRLAEEFGHLLPEKGRTFIEKIQTSSERMANMIDSILSYSVVNATELSDETIDLRLLLEGIMSDLELLMVQKEARISFDNLPRIKGEPTLIYQLFYNLINNALKFSKSGVPARIHISSRSLTKPESTALDLPKNKDYLEITVKDNGIGFSQEYAQKVFNVFTRLNSRDQYEGTGLGLALCRKIVYRHGGIMYAQSVEGEGATFYIVLPERR